VQPHRAGERGVGELPGRREGRAETRKAWRGYGRQRGGPRSKSMKAIAVIPGQAGSVHLAELPKPRLNEVPEGRGVLVRVLSVGLDGTDKEINAAAYGAAPPGSSFLVLGHESLGVVEQVGPGVTEVKPGERVVATGSPAGQQPLRRH